MPVQPAATTSTTSAEHAGHATRPHPQRGPGRLAFPAVSAVFILFTAASAAPSPLYAVYQRQWHFSAWVLTVVFAVYAVSLLAALLTVGGLSDHLGRRPVLAAAVGLEAVALLLFVAASNVAVLSTARVLQGYATGAATTTLSAALVDLEPAWARGRAAAVTSVAPLIGLALGAVGSGLLVEFGVWPTRLVYLVLLAGTGLAAVVAARMPETSPRRPGALASLRPRVAMPAYLRADLATLVPVVVAAWALTAMYLSLGPSVAAELLGLRGSMLGGVVVTLLTGPASLTVLLPRLRALPGTSLLVPGATLLGLGTLTSLAGTVAHLAVVAAVGTVVAGVGVGASALAAIGTVARIARPHQRGEIFALFNVVCYLAISVPVVLGGVAVTAVGTRTATVGYALAVAAFALVAVVLTLARRPGPRRG